jgi:uncharacterized membrane protein YphA (DoxX/SURF4 family)
MNKKTALTWALRVLMAIGFLIPAATKVIGDEQWTQEFTTIGFGLWFMYFVAVVEVVAAILLLYPVTTPWGVLLSLCIVMGALVAQVLYFMHFPHIVIYTTVLLVLLYLTRDRLGLSRSNVGPA